MKRERLRNFLSFLCNLGLTIGLVSIVRQIYDPAKGIDFKALRYFSVHANLIGGTAGAFMLTDNIRRFFSPADPFVRWKSVWKFIGTAALAVTFFTVVLLLAPRKGYGDMLFTGNNLYMHLISPVLAVLSLCVFERGGRTRWPEVLLSLLPVFIYMFVYNINVFCIREWKDFYDLRALGGWRVMPARILPLNALVSLLLWGLTSVKSESKAKRQA